MKIEVSKQDLVRMISGTYIENEFGRSKCSFTGPDKEINLHGSYVGTYDLTWNIDYLNKMEIEDLIELYREASEAHLAQ